MLMERQINTHDHFDAQSVENVSNCMSQQFTNDTLQAVTLLCHDFIALIDKLSTVIYEAIIGKKKW